MTQMTFSNSNSYTVSYPLVPSEAFASYWVRGGITEPAILVRAIDQRELMEGNFEAMIVTPDAPGEKWSSYYPDPLFSLRYAIVPQRFGWFDKYRKSEINKPLDIMPRKVGDSAAVRTVYLIELPDNPVLDDLYMGVTVHSGPGSWSSWPPHKFERDSLLAPLGYRDFFEKFAFVTDPPSQWGLQMVMGKTASEAKIIQDRDIVTIPLSSHPVVGGPECRMAYVWAYTGGENKFPGGERV